MVLWIVTVLALLVALAAMAHSRRTARQLAEVTQMYWQLKFDHGELKAKVDPQEANAAAKPPVPSKRSCPCPQSRNRDTVRDCG